MISPIFCTKNFQNILIFCKIFLFFQLCKSVKRLMPHPVLNTNRELPDSQSRQIYNEAGTEKSRNRGLNFRSDDDLSFDTMEQLYGKLKQLTNREKWYLTTRNLYRKHFVQFLKIKGKLYLLNKEIASVNIDHKASTNLNA